MMRPMEKKPQVIIFVGPPGAGKGTQADLLAEDFGFYHFETSKIIEEKFATSDPEDPVIKGVKEAFTTGKLADPKVVTEWVLEKMRVLGAQKTNLVFSGSYRTEYEASTEIPVTEELYGKENIHVILINVGEEEAVKRNSTRRICKANRHPIPNFSEFEGITACPKDGSEIIKRSLDTVDVMRVRYQTYLKETAPVLDIFKQHGYDIIEIKGEQGIREVHNDIVMGVHKTAHPDLLQKLMG
jgi:adenylate kinase